MEVPEETPPQSGASWGMAVAALVAGVMAFAVVVLLWLGLGGLF